MKKTYLQPAMITLALHQAQMLCESVTKVNADGGSTTGILYGGQGSGPARVKETNIWDEEW